MSERWPYTSPGIPDSLFKRAAGVPMTKQEVRAVTLAEMRLFAGAVVCDIGAGTGSVTVECAHLGCRRVFAVERDPAARAVLEDNVRLFGLENVTVLAGHAPGVLEDLPPLDRVFLGGSGGSLQEILPVVQEKLKPGGRLVVNSVTLETGPKVHDYLQKNNFSDLNVVAVNISRATSRGRADIWQALSPVQVISGQKGEI